MLTREQFAEKHPFLGDYNNSYDIKIFPIGVKERQTWSEYLDGLIDIFDMLKLSLPFYNAVNDILGRCLNAGGQDNDDGEIYLFDSYMNDYYGYIQDGSCYLSKDEVFHRFKTKLFRMGIEVNWPDEYLCEVLVRKGLIVPPPEFFSETFSGSRKTTYVDENDGQPCELLLMVKKPIFCMPVEDEFSDDYDVAPARGGNGAICAGFISIREN